MEPRNVIVDTSGSFSGSGDGGVQAQELTEVPASEILEQIQAGEDVYLENVRITGELDVRRIELEIVPVARTEFEIKRVGLKEELKIIESEIIIINSVFENYVYFSNTQFRKSADFHDTSFLDFSDFRGASFGSYANFRDVSFGGDTGFEFASFNDDANFESTNFGGYANFEVTSFSGRAYFTYANFSDDADFKSATFSEGANFWDATFGDDAYFWHVHFSGNTYFDGVNFSGNAEFTSAEFDEVDFSDTAFSQMFLLYDADFKRMKIRWSSLKDLHSFDGLTYIKLIKKFQRDGAV